MGLMVDTRNRMDSIMMVMVESFTQINPSIACDLNNNVLDLNIFITTLLSKTEM